MSTCDTIIPSALSYTHNDLELCRQVHRAGPLHKATRQKRLPQDGYLHALGRLMRLVIRRLWESRAQIPLSWQETQAIDGLGAWHNSIASSNAHLEYYRKEPL